MYFTSFVVLLIPLLAAHALPAPIVPRDDPQALSISSSSSSSAAGNTPSATTDHASMYSSQANSLLKALQSEMSAVDPSGTAYTAYITTVSSRLAVEMSPIGGSGHVMFVAATATLSTQSHDAPTATATRASTIDRANDAATGLPSIPTALPSGGPELSSLLSEIASAELDEATKVINSASKTVELTAYITEVAGTPYVALSSINGPAITLAATSGAADAFPTSFDGLAVTAILSKNAATGLSASRSSLAGVVGAFAVVGAGAMVIL